LVHQALFSFFISKARFAPLLYFANYSDAPPKVSSSNDV